MKRAILPVIVAATPRPTFIGRSRALARLHTVFLVAVVCGIGLNAQSQAGKDADRPGGKPAAKAVGPTADTLAGLAFRSIGPAVTSGRVIDIAVDPGHPATWYVATVGGVWKTENAGTSWTPVFDGQGSFSIGCVTVDPDEPARRLGRHRREQQPAQRRRTATASTGRRRRARRGRTSASRSRAHRADRRRPARLERRLRRRAWGRSGPPGGDRGLYKTTDGGKTWKRGADDQREHGRQRRRDRPAQPRRALRRRLPAPPPRLDADRRRPGVGALQVAPTAARPGRSSRTACRRRTWAASASPSRRRTPTSSTPIVEAAQPGRRVLPLDATAARAGRR